MMKQLFSIIIITLCSLHCATAQNVISRLITNDRLGKKDSVANWTIHAQATVVYQYHPAFHAAYSGVKSLSSSAEGALSLTSTIFLGRKLWKGAAFFFNPELTGGTGLSKTVGIAGFSNGEIYRIGNPTPTPYLARAYIQQVISLKHSTTEVIESDKNQLAGRRPESRIVISLGKFCISDFFDANTYSHDARSQFLNWALMAQGAWDFPADVRGYTTGFVVELIKPLWAIRFSGVQVPKTANGADLDWHLDKANSETLEAEKDWAVKGHKGAVRLTGYISFSKAPKYAAALDSLAVGDSTLVKVMTGTAEGTHYGGIKYGFCLNAEQDLGYGIGIFARAGWNDGHTATWAFTEIDNSLSLGINVKGSTWKRVMDNAGVAIAVNGLSPDHRRYLEAGQYGFIIGDGALRYGSEFILEFYYRAQIASFLSLSPDYQFVVNPAYNKDRGPVHIPGIRVHLEF